MFRGGRPGAPRRVQKSSDYAILFDGAVTSVRVAVVLIFKELRVVQPLVVKFDIVNSQSRAEIKGGGHAISEQTVLERRVVVLVGALASGIHLINFDTAILHFRKLRLLGPRGDPQRNGVT